MRPSAATILIFPLLAPAPAAGLEFEAGAGLLDFEYEEFDDADRSLDREHGLIPGLQMTVRRLRGDLALEGYAAVFGGSVDYDGHAQDLTTGATRPHETTTDQRLWRLGLGLAGTGDAAPYLRLTRHWWERDIRPRDGVAGAYELYSWWEPALGLRWSVPVGSAGDLELDAAVFRITAPDLDAEISGFDPLTLELGEEPGYRLRLRYGWPLRRDLTATLGLFLESWEFGRSADREATSGGTPTGLLFHEPRSETFHRGLTLTLSSPW